MKQICFVSALILATALPATTAQAGYGGGGAVAARKTCHIPKLKNVQPEARSSVSPGSTVSAVVSSKVIKSSIQVSIKGQALETTISKKSNIAYQLESRLPDTLEDGFIRIKVKGKGKSPGCKLSDGWLLQVSNASTPAADAIEAETTETADESTPAATTDTDTAE